MHISCRALSSRNGEREGGKSYFSAYQPQPCAGADKKAAGSRKTFPVPAGLHDGFIGASFAGRFSLGPLWTRKLKSRKHARQTFEKYKNNFKPLNAKLIKD